jgi:hypothetical protein
MEDSKKNDLLYVPVLKPDRTYRSDAEFIEEVEDDIPPIPDEPAKNTPAQIYHDFEEVQDLIPDFPEIKKSIELLKKRLMIAFPDGSTPEPHKRDVIAPKSTKIPEINFISDIPKETNPGVNNLPNMFPSTTNIALKVVSPRTLVQIIQDGYDTDQVNLQNYYLQQLQLIIQKYFQEMLMVMAECGVENIDNLTKKFDGDTVEVSDPNLGHLRDHIVRSQIIRDQKKRYMKKTHNVDQTMMHMRAWHIAKEERVKYYGEKYGDSGSYLDSHSNGLLRENRSSHDQKYSDALYNMYKYLNSSISLMDDILSMTVKEAQAKGKLLNAGVKIYESAETKEAEEDAAREKAEEAKEEENEKTLNSQKQLSMTGEEIKKGNHIDLDGNPIDQPDSAAANKTTDAGTTDDKTDDAKSTDSSKTGNTDNGTAAKTDTTTAAQSQQLAKDALDKVKSGKASDLIGMLSGGIDSSGAGCLGGHDFGDLSKITSPSSAAISSSNDPNRLEKAEESDAKAKADKEQQDAENKRKQEEAEESKREAAAYQERLKQRDEVRNTWKASPEYQQYQQVKAEADSMAGRMATNLRNATSKYKAEHGCAPNESWFSSDEAESKYGLDRSLQERYQELRRKEASLYSSSMDKYQAW